MTSHTDDTDLQVRFLLPHAGVRGVSVHLHTAWRELLSHQNYPPTATGLLGQTCAAAVLFTGHTKIDGRLSIQLRSQTPLRTLFAECTAAGNLRGIAQLQDNHDAPDDLRQLGDDALLAITIENPGLNPREPQRYQSLVALNSPTLATAFEDYFRQSEQLPTRLLLAADGDHAAGLMLQKLPGDEGDADGWNRACALFDTLPNDELLHTPPHALIHRLFHQEAPEQMAQRPLHFACSCSRQRVAAMLQSLGQDEAQAALQDGLARVRCEFCGQQYQFDASQITELFSLPPVGPEAPATLQ